MCPKTRIVFFGGGGVAIDTARYVLDIDRQLGDQGSVVVSDLVDEGTGRVSDLESILGYKISVHHDISTVKHFEQKRVVVTLGHSPIRHEKFNYLKELGAVFYTVIHPQADIADTASIGQSCIFAPFTVVSPFAAIGDNVIVNVRSTIGHDAVVGESSILSPHVVISGSAVCGKSVFAGAAAVVAPGVHIGDFAKLSAGAVIVDKVFPGYLAHGNPAQCTRMFHYDNGRSLFEMPRQMLSE